MRAVDHEFKVQTVVTKQDGGRDRSRTLVACEKTRVREWHRRHAAREVGLQGAILDRVGDHLGMGALGERRHLVEHALRELDDAGGPMRVEAWPPCGLPLIGDRVRPVERVIEASPAGVRGVERIARVRHGHDELWPGHTGDLVVDAARLQGRFTLVRKQVADGAEEGEIRILVEIRPPMAAQVGIDAGLHVVPNSEQLPVAGCEIANQSRETAPECFGVEAGALQRLAIHEIVEELVDSQPCGTHPCHDPVLLPRRRL